MKKIYVSLSSCSLTVKLQLHVSHLGFGRYACFIGMTMRSLSTLVSVLRDKEQPELKQPISGLISFSLLLCISCTLVQCCCHFSLTTLIMEGCVSCDMTGISVAIGSCDASLSVWYVNSLPMIPACAGSYHKTHLCRLISVLTVALTLLRPLIFFSRTNEKQF